MPENASQTDAKIQIQGMPPAISSRQELEANAPESSQMATLLLLRLTSVIQSLSRLSSSEALTKTITKTHQRHTLSRLQILLMAQVPSVRQLDSAHHLSLLVQWPPQQSPIPDSAHPQTEEELWPMQPLTSLPSVFIELSRDKAAPLSRMARSGSCSRTRTPRLSAAARCKQLQRELMTPIILISTSHERSDYNVQEICTYFVKHAKL